MSVKFPENTPMTVPQPAALRSAAHRPRPLGGGVRHWGGASGAAGGGASGAAAAGVFSASGPRASLSAAFRPVEGEPLAHAVHAHAADPECRAAGAERAAGDAIQGENTAAERNRSQTAGARRRV